MLSLEVGDAAPVEVVSPHGAQYIWTRKRGGVRVRGHGARAARSTPPGSSTSPPATTRATRRGCGRPAPGSLASGEPVAWNLVDGVHDSPVASERTVWVDGVPREVPPQRFDGLAGVGDLRFSAQATRARRERLVLMSLRLRAALRDVRAARCPAPASCARAGA